MLESAFNLPSLFPSAEAMAGLLVCLVVGVMVWTLIYNEPLLIKLRREVDRLERKKQFRDKIAALEVRREILKRELGDEG